MSGASMAAQMEAAEKSSGRHADLLSRAETAAIRCARRTASGMDATVVRELIAVIARQEIELRQAIREKCTRPVVTRL